MNTQLSASLVALEDDSDDCPVSLKVGNEVRWDLEESVIVGDEVRSDLEESCVWYCYVR